MLVPLHPATLVPLYPVFCFYGFYFVLCILQLCLRYAVECPVFHVCNFCVQASVMWSLSQLVLYLFTFDFHLYIYTYLFTCIHCIFICIYIFFFPFFPPLVCLFQCKLPASMNVQWCFFCYGHVSFILRHDYSFVDRSVLELIEICFFCSGGHVFIVCFVIFIYIYIFY